MQEAEPKDDDEWHLKCRHLCDAAGTARIKGAPAKGMMQLREEKGSIKSIFNTYYFVCW